MWRNRWIESTENFDITLDQDGSLLSDRNIIEIINILLSDRSGSGCPSGFTEEDLMLLQLLACEDPQKYNLPFTNWTHKELSKQATKIGINISPSWYGILLKNDLRPQKSEYWIFPKIEDEQEFVEIITKVSLIYKEALEPNNKIVVTCTDEKKDIHAINSMKTKPAEKGKPQKIDPEYKRNGTTCLIAGLDVKTGKIAHYSQGQTRQEDDS
ncbi:hypothetical protein DMA11_17630 [Marinilabiliaceae bacterium JC017]|nr:hypothetical protein DMA11_17630 [Marinilabiliaceae bacterium JC017]